MLVQGLPIEPFVPALPEGAQLLCAQSLAVLMLRLPPASVGRRRHNRRHRILPHIGRFRRDKNSHHHAGIRGADRSAPGPRWA